MHTNGDTAMTTTYIRLAYSILSIMERRNDIPVKQVDELLHTVRLDINNAYKNSMITRHQADALNCMANVI